ncbi:MAG: ABC-F family ATP-binding cassette domain-containing protein [Anaerofustis stercorihominis]|nr:ABC-F family ATP-binding cassette domain-containing protein [Anaerofustis stercorihominis]
MQIKINNISKSFGEHDVLRNITFEINYFSKIGIVGSNGAGKSTLIKIISSIIEADSGNVIIGEGETIAYLRQDNEDMAVYFSDDANSEELMILSRLDFDEERLKSEGTLSGGERTKYALAKILSQNPTILILDEPTNNLDYFATRELISLLDEYYGTLIVVSHDRFFLDETVSEIIEVEGGKITRYDGNYTDYTITKQRLFDEQMARYLDGVKRQKEIRDAIARLNDWSAKAHRDSTKPAKSGLTMGTKEFRRAKAKKMDNQVKSQKKRLEKLIERSEEKPKAQKEVFFSIRSSETKGRSIVRAEGISKSFGDVKLFENSDFFINRGEHIAVFGKNGCGKSTLINIIRGLDSVDSGEMWVSEGVKPYILEQTFGIMTDGDKTVLRYLQEKFGVISGLMRTNLDNLGLNARLMNSKLSTLSFGELMKVKLAEPIIDQRDFLILDEPTTHLDLPSREMLERTLKNYEGTMLVVSHDIYFLKELCDKVLVYENGKIKRLEYSFGEYLERVEKQ